MDVANWTGSSRSDLGDLGMKMKKHYSKPTLVKDQKLVAITAVSSKPF